MSRYRIIIEGAGPHHSNEDTKEGEAVVVTHDADKVTKDTVATLQALGHTVTKADFVLRGFQDDDPEKEISALRVDDLLPEPAAVEGDRGTGESDEAEK